MKGDIAIAGFVLTAEEWLALDPFTRAQLVTVAARREEAWVVAPATGVLSEPNPAAATDE